jgi:hypothetical protein
MSLVAAPVLNDRFLCPTIRSNKISKSPPSDAGTIMKQFPLAS